MAKAGHNQTRPFPHWRGVSPVADPRRNFEVYEPLDFLAQVTQHIPDRYEHQIRYYGWYSNKSRGLRAKAETPRREAPSPEENPLETRACRRKRKQQWAALIKKVYEVDPLVCPECGSHMKIVAFIPACAPARPAGGEASAGRQESFAISAYSRPPPVLRRKKPRSKLLLSPSFLPD